MLPTNEKETVELFKNAKELLRWKLKKWNGNFPDATIENHDGHVLAAEFEYEAKNFEKHGHNPSGCDLIICWNNNWKDAPLPVWELKSSFPRLVRDLLAQARKEFETRCRLASRVDQLEKEVASLQRTKRPLWKRFLFFCKDFLSVWREIKMTQICELCGRPMSPTCHFLSGEQFNPSPELTELFSELGYEPSDLTFRVIVYTCASCQNRKMIAQLNMVKIEIEKV